MPMQIPPHIAHHVASRHGQPPIPRRGRAVPCPSRRFRELHPTLAATWPRPND